MKRPWESRCTMVGEKITRLTSGNTAIRSDRWSLTSGWAGSGKDRSGSWATSKASCKATVNGAYDHIGGPGLVHAACWAHARRKFFDAVKLNPKDTTSIQIVAQMDELFGIDAQAR